MKKIILRLLPWVIVAALLAALTVFVIIPLFAPEEAAKNDPPIIHIYEGDKKPLTMENDALLFELDPATTHFKVTDKATGEVWLSNPEGAANDTVAVSTNKENLQSTLLVTYATSAGVVERNNFKYSIQDGNYVIKPQEDGSIRVEYAIGEIEKVYMIPVAITKDDFVALTDNMKKSTKKKVTGNYALFDPAKLDADDAEIIAMYPSVQEQPLYILKSSTKEKNKADMEGYFAEAGYTQADYERDMALVAGAKESTKPVFNVTVVYRLDGRDLLVEVPYNEVRYRPEYPITHVTVLPMFGAAGRQDEGFMFIPEGGGALINLNNGKLQQNSYYANVYGWDYATQRKEMKSETRNTFPVFGMSRNGKSFLCMIEGATSYSGVLADISLRYNSYNWLCAKHAVLHNDLYNVSAKTSQLVYMFEKEIPNDVIVQRYRFLDTGSYVDMANAYGDYLRETIPALAEAKASEDMPVSVELIGAIDKTVVKFGLPIDSVVATTTFAQAEEIIADLTGKGVRNLNVRMSGWANGGITQKVFTGVNILGELGGKDGMSKLIKSAGEAGVTVFFDGVNCFAYDSGVLEGFMPFNNAARYTTREQVMLEPFDIVTYQPADWLDSFYLVRPDYAAANASNMIRELGNMNAAGVSFRDIGSMLSADYNPKDTTTREQVKAMNIATMTEAADKGMKVMIKIGNDYAVPYADVITDMELVGTKYGIIDESVPFYQIALHGMKDYTAAPINLAGDYLEEFLRCAEYGSGLNFTFMAEDAKILQDTTHSTLFGSNYSSWAEDAVTMITKYQQDMAGLNQTRIVSHEWLSDSVVATGYENGAVVYVNYGSIEQTVNGVTIPARSYTVERGE